MSEQAKYPARGCLSDDGRLYTRFDGCVFEWCEKPCSCKKVNCVNCIASLGVCALWQLIEGAYVPSSEEVAACDMARAMIHMCDTKAVKGLGCINCSWRENKDCPSRVYLAAHGDATAWEVGG